MCGRFTLINWQELIVRFGVAAYDLQPRYNIAPTQGIPVIVQGAKELRLFRWGLIPFWAADETFAARLINARAETVLEKKSFRHCMQQKRCLIPADGFYEWKKEGNKKQPYYFSLTGGQLFAFAGLWDKWRAPDGSEIFTCTIITTQANQLVAEIHQRMPVILPPEAEAMWLDPQLRQPEVLQSLLQPYPAAMIRRAVSPLINRPNFDGPEVLNFQA
ncbi:MAG TPA: SOS response-associated peptidase [Oscillospiraceae bacterium]|nr:SOS response-associated peptidase [Oscillospiraceae bacterium]